MNNDNQYDKASNGTIIVPFSIKFEPMESLLLINFKKAEDSVYKCFEIQKF